MVTKGFKEVPHRPLTKGNLCSNSLIVAAYRLCSVLAMILSCSSL